MTINKKNNLRLNAPIYPVQNYTNLNEKDKLALLGEGILAFRRETKANLKKELVELKKRFKQYV